MQTRICNDYIVITTDITREFAGTLFTGLTEFLDINLLFISLYKHNNATRLIKSHQFHKY